MHAMTFIKVHIRHRCAFAFFISKCLTLMAIFQGRVKATYLVQVSIAIKEEVRCEPSIDIFTHNLAHSNG